MRVLSISERVIAWCAKAKSAIAINIFLDHISNWILILSGYAMLVQSYTHKIVCSRKTSMYQQFLSFIEMNKEAQVDSGG